MQFNDLNNLVITSTNPCLLVYLVDQSQSMSDTFGNANHSKAKEVSNAINDILYEVGLRCIGTAGEIKNRFEVAILGYGKELNSVQSAWEGSLQNKWVVSIKDIFEYPLGQTEDKPIWIKPYSNNDTPMTKAFENAHRLCQDWIEWGNHKDCHPPIIINITDGEATDAGFNYTPLQEQVGKIKALITNFGHAFVLNIHISSTAGDRKLFPSSLDSSDKFGRLLFELSSPLNDNMLRIAKAKEYQVQNGSKGYVFNGNASDLINFLNIGTPQ